MGSDDQKQKIIEKIKKQKDDNERLNILVDIFWIQNNAFPMDTSMKLITHNLGKENHESLNFPGIYIEPLSTEVETAIKTNLRMDELSLIAADGITTTMSNVLGNEYQAELPTPKKEEITLFYRTGATYRYGYTVLINYVGNFGSKKETEEIIEVGEHKFNALLTNINDDEVEKRLNSVSNKIDNREKLPTQEALNLSYASIYPSEYIAKSTIKKVVEKFTEAKIDNSKVKSIIFHTIKNMVKHRFRDDEKQARRLLKMMTKQMMTEHYKHMANFYDFEETVERELKLHQEIEDRDKEIQDKDKKISELEQLLKKHHISPYYQNPPYSK